jgi:S1-C subfamily serine protease
MFCKNCGIEINTGASFCKDCGEKVVSPNPVVAVKNKTASWFRKKAGLIIGLFFAGFILLLVAGYLSEETSTNSPVAIDNATQEEIALSVVNIFCPSTRSEEEASGGSGTIIDEEGLILTNSHIVPQDETNIFVDDTGCLVVLPDPVTGQPDEVFLAHPIVIPGISDSYDLAYMQIYSAFYDEEEAKYAGTYPRVFPAFDDTTRCRNENVQLGEPVRIFGYPAISGGYSLTITDGVVSSFPGEGLIVTSAKISHGNSGGLAVDRRGCMIGVPSMVSSDEAESLGVIISTQLMNSFSEEVSTYLNALEN